MKSIVGLLFCVAAFLGGCASMERPDPLEPMNRKVFAFNQGLDKVVLKPVATTYEKVVPAPIRTGAGNFFANTRDLWSATNLLLQGRGADGMAGMARFGTNTVFGVLGVFDVATGWGLERQTSDLGLTLQRWGVGPGAYLVLPVFGASTVRDAAGLPADLWATPLTAITNVPLRNSLTAADLVNTRARLLPVTRVLDDVALDPYLFVRDAYLQRRGYPEDPQAEAR